MGQIGGAAGQRENDHVQTSWMRMKTNVRISRGLRKHSLLVVLYKTAWGRLEGSIGCS
eukprot:Pgem_evm1s9973